MAQRPSLVAAHAQHLRKGAMRFLIAAYNAEDVRPRGVIPGPPQSEPGIFRSGLRAKAALDSGFAHERAPNDELRSLSFVAGVALSNIQAQNSPHRAKLARWPVDG